MAKNHDKKKMMGKLQKAVLGRTVVPMIIMGIIIALSVYLGYKNTVKDEIFNSLENMATSIAGAYDEMYPGDYALVGDNILTFYKGSTDITGKYTLIDRVKADSDVDISIVHGNTRILTTLKNEYSERAIMTPINGSVVTKAQKKNEIIMSDAFNGSVKYYACYKPIYNSDDSYVGVIEVLKPVTDVNEEANQSALPVLLIAIVCIIFASIIITRYTRNIIVAMEKICNFLRGMISGNLSNDMPKEVLSRNDELGTTGKTIVNMQNAIRVLVERDALTGLYNRRYGNAKLRKVQSYADKSGMPFAVAIGDIDFFKKVNDTYGHEAGDVVLKRVAEIMNKAMSGKGFVARWGGEEFLLVFNKTGKAGGAKELNAILNQIRRMVIVYNDMTIRVTMSFGIVDGSVSCDFGALLRTADAKLYYAKEHGRNQVVDIEIDEAQPEEVPYEEPEETVEEEPQEPVVVEGADFGAMLNNGAIDDIIEKFTENVINEDSEEESNL